MAVQEVEKKWWRMVVKLFFCFKYYEFYKFFQRVGRWLWSSAGRFCRLNTFVWSILSARSVFGRALARAPRSWVNLEVPANKRRAASPRPFDSFPPTTHRFRRAKKTQLREIPKKISRPMFYIFQISHINYMYYMYMYYMYMILSYVHIFI